MTGKKELHSGMLHRDIKSAVDKVNELNAERLRKAKLRKLIVRVGQIFKRDGHEQETTRSFDIPLPEKKGLHLEIELSKISPEFWHGAINYATLKYKISYQAEGQKDREDIVQLKYYDISGEQIGLIKQQKVGPLNPEMDNLIILFNSLLDHIENHQRKTQPKIK